MSYHRVFELLKTVGLARAMMRLCRKVEGGRWKGWAMQSKFVGTGGATVSKQGNRSSSSACGSVDVLEDLGVAIDLDPEVGAFWMRGVTMCVNEAGIGFMMAPSYHPAMEVVRHMRKKLRMRTVFNILGPMLNPARVPFAFVRVYAENMVVQKDVLESLCL